LQWRDESKEQSANITYLTSSDCQSSHANPFFMGGAPPGGLDPRLTTIELKYCWKVALDFIKQTNKQTNDKKEKK
jgi:hypothetical protein